MELRSAQNDNSMANVYIKIKTNPLLDNLENYVVEFGKFEINFSPLTKLILRKEKQGQQLLIPSSLSIGKIKLAKLRLFDIPKGTSKCTITGCDLFEDGRIVFVDSSEANKRLVIMNSEGSFITEIQFQDRSLDVTIINSNTVAVTMFEEELIFKVDIDTSKILLTIPVNEKCFGICFVDGKLVVSLKHDIIKIVDLSGNVMSQISQIDDSTHSEE
ncbi:unnamed protein product [Mytilus coruscus]|uniref:Uncharacterized protein n=1 Tax=Mytilus coruscus TaxID=42192 RepID=A0A6J8BNX7_MYTCO|nr:unnamed protein product [Mytilus coruscus]